MGDKTPEYVRSLPALHDLWPTAKFIHVIRDGRDVRLSATNWRKEFKLARRFATWGDDPIMTAAVWWDWLVRLGREDGNTLGPDLYHEVRYESLVVDPASTCAELCTFLSIPYDEVILRLHEGRSREDPGLDAKQAWLPITAGLRDWRSQMAPEDVERFEAATGDLLDELGNERAVPNPMAEALEHAATIREAFAQDLRRRGQRSPGPQSAPL